MNPKEKAEDLIDKFTWHPRTEVSMQRTKQCALIHVDEILKLGLVSPLMMYGMNYVSVHDFYSQVKKEIEEIEKL